MRLKATFQNDDRRLIPPVRKRRAHARNTDRALVVPSQAVQIGQDKSFVYVSVDGTVEMRVVQPGAVADTMTVIEDGLKPGSR